MAQTFRPCCDIQTRQVLMAVFKVDHDGDRNLLVNGEPSLGDSAFFATAYANIYAGDVK